MMYDVSIEGTFFKNSTLCGTDSFEFRSKRVNSQTLGRVVDFLSRAVHYNYFTIPGLCERDFHALKGGWYDRFFSSMSYTDLSNLFAAAEELRIELFTKLIVHYM